MATFDELVEELIAIEGGAEMTDRAADRGSLTKYGISQRAFPELDIPTITKQEAIDIYKKKYWDKFKIGSLPEEARRDIFFNVVVSGAGGIKGLQKELGIAVDGVVGPQTRKAIKNYDGDITRAIKSGQIKRFADIAEGDATQRENLNGWMNRALGKEVFGKNLIDVRSLPMDEVRDIALGKVDEVTEEPLPEPPVDPTTMSRVPTRTNVEEQTLQSVANPVASDEADDEFISRLYEGLGRVLNAPQRASQTPSRGRIEPEPPQQEPDPEEEQLTEGEQKLIDSTVNYTEQVEPTKSTDDVELTDGELRMLERATGMSASRIREELGANKTNETTEPRASGTVETEKPVVVPNNGEQNDSSKDPIFGIF